jgi:hypothetical protein
MKKIGSGTPAVQFVAIPTELSELGSRRNKSKENMRAVSRFSIFEEGGHKFSCSEGSQEMMKVGD